MSRVRRLLATLPALVVGISAAGAAEMSAGLLLYSTEGFLPALTLILTVETGAFALGLWSGSVPTKLPLAERLRRRWLFVLVTFAVAAAFSTGMTLLGELFNGGVGQGLGLAFLGSLPLFALGSLLGGMVGQADPSLRRVALPAVVGLALGFLLTGGFLLPNLAPYTLYLLCLTALSGGALLNGWLLGSEPRARVLAEARTARGEALVEERVGLGTREVLRVLVEGGRVRGAETITGSLGRSWEVGVLSALLGGGRDPGPALYLGGGSGGLARHLLQAFPSMVLQVVEGTETLTNLAKAHFHPFPRWEEVQVRIEEPWVALERIQGPFALILVDSQFLPSLGALPDMTDARWELLSTLTGAGGSVVLGGLAPVETLGEVPLDALLKGAARHFARVAHYKGEEEGFLLLSGSEAPYWSAVLPGFHVTPGQEE